VSDPVAGARALELLGLVRRFGDVVALDDVTFSVEAGQMVGFVGPNGAGKTTAMRIARGVLILCGQLFAYGYWVASGVVEEKSFPRGRGAARDGPPVAPAARRDLRIGLLGLAQLLLIGVVGVRHGAGGGEARFPLEAIATLGLVLGWFVPGFFNASLFAVAGSIVTRQEDLQTTMTPLTILIVASFFIGISGTSSPNSTLAIVASLLPFSSPLVMPTRIALRRRGVVGGRGLDRDLGRGDGGADPARTKIHSRALLRGGRVRIRQVLRGREA
jgi:ABC-2 type transport system permease protein